MVDICGNRLALSMESVWAMYILIVLNLDFHSLVADEDL
jgi:hypothetical protein